MIEGALVAVVFSLVPLLLADLDLAEVVLWRTACGLFLVGWTVVFVVTVRRGFEVLRQVEIEADPGWRRLVATLGVLTFGVLFAGGVGFASSTAYLLALLLQLILCSLFFYRFFVSVHAGSASGVS